MIEKYMLNADALPAIPTPHDCKIKSFKECGDYLVIEFGDDLSSHDSILNLRPDAKMLTMRIRLTDDFEVYERKSKVSLLKGEGYILLNNRKFIEKTLAGDMEYLYHWLTYNGMIIQLYPYHVISLFCDSVEMIWDE